MLKSAVLPGQSVRLPGVVADVLVNTVSVAQFVTLVQKPVTWTQYCAASDDVMLVIEKELFVAPARGAPAFVH